MAVTVTRDMINQYAASTAGGTTVDGLFIRDVDEFIPLMKDVNADFIKKLPSKGTVNKLKYEWGEGDLTPNTFKLTAPAAAGVTTLTPDFPKYAQKFDLILNKRTGEVVRMTADPGATTLTVARGHGSTVDAPMNLGDEMLILGPAVPEGADTPDSPSSQGSLDFNYPQILEYSWTTTHRGKVTPTYEFKSDRFKIELKRKMEEAARDLNLIAIYGIRSMGDGQKTNPSTTGGAREFAKVATDLSGDPITLEDILDMYQDRYLDVGNVMAKDVWLHPADKRILNSFLNPMRMANVSDAKLNMNLDSMETDFGTITFKTDTEFPRGELHTFNFKDLGRYAYEGGNWTTGMFSTEGWYDRGFLRGDFGFKWAAPRRRAAILNFSTDTTDYPNYGIQGLQLSPTINVTP